MAALTRSFEGEDTGGAQNVVDSRVSAGVLTRTPYRYVSVSQEQGLIYVRVGLRRRLRKRPVTRQASPASTRAIGVDPVRASSPTVEAAGVP